mgnify:FL=1
MSNVKSIYNSITSKCDYYAGGDIMKIYNVKKTNEFAPSQWEGKTKDGQMVYIKYRNGYLSLGVGKDINEAIENLRVIHKTRRKGSCMPTLTMLRLIERIY